MTDRERLDLVKRYVYEADDFAHAQFNLLIKFYYKLNSLIDI